MKVKSESEVAQSYLTLSDSMDCSPSGSLSMGFSRQEWGATAFFYKHLSNAYNQSCQEKQTNSAVFHVATCGTPRDQWRDPNPIARCRPCLIWQHGKPVFFPLVFSSVLTVLLPGIFQVYLQISHLILITLMLGRWYKPLLQHAIPPVLYSNNFSDHLWFVFPFHRKSDI